MSKLDTCISLPLDEKVSKDVIPIMQKDWAMIRMALPRDQKMNFPKIYYTVRMLIFK